MNQVFKSTLTSWSWGQLQTFFLSRNLSNVAENYRIRPALVLNFEVQVPRCNICLVNWVHVQLLNWCKMKFHILLLLNLINQRVFVWCIVVRSLRFAGEIHSWTRKSTEEEKLVIIETTTQSSHISYPSSSHQWFSCWLSFRCNVSSLGLTPACLIVLLFCL